MRKKLKKIYLEITNICNLSCAFCEPCESSSSSNPRKKTMLSIEHFKSIMEKIEGKSDILYFHVMGEPLLHPDLALFIALANEKKFKVHITTNGSLLKNAQEKLRHSKLKRLNISLQSIEQFPQAERKKKTDEILEASQNLLKTNPELFISLRLWTQDRTDFSKEIASYIESFFSLPSGTIRESLQEKNSLLLEQQIAIHAADSFDWPDFSLPLVGENGFCMALRDQIAILSDGTVGPCCLDRNAHINLGNILHDDWNEIIFSERSLALYNGFSNRNAVEKLCQHCSYRKRFD